MYWAYLNPEVHWLVIRACNNMSRVANKVSTNPMMTDPSFFLTQYISRGENFWTWVGAALQSGAWNENEKHLSRSNFEKMSTYLSIVSLFFLKRGCQTFLIVPIHKRFVSNHWCLQKLLFWFLLQTPNTYKKHYCKSSCSILFVGIGFMKQKY